MSSTKRKTVIVDGEIMYEDDPRLLARQQAARAPPPPQAAAPPRGGAAPHPQQGGAAAGAGAGAGQPLFRLLEAQPNAPLGEPGSRALSALQSLRGMEAQGWHVCVTHCVLAGIPDAEVLGNRVPGVLLVVMALGGFMLGW